MGETDRVRMVLVSIGDIIVLQQPVVGYFSFIQIQHNCSEISGDNNREEAQIAD